MEIRVSINATVIQRTRLKVKSIVKRNPTIFIKWKRKRSLTSHKDDGQIIRVLEPSTRTRTTSTKKTATKKTITTEIKIMWQQALRLSRHVHVIDATTQKYESQNQLTRTQKSQSQNQLTRTQKSHLVANLLQQSLPNRTPSNANVTWVTKHQQ
jgi:sugar diacid utilization regulator